MSVKLYLSPIIDFHTREIVSYCVSESPNYAQVRKMLNDVFRKYGDRLKGAILHSDQGYQYQMKVYQKALIEKDIIQSIVPNAKLLDGSLGVANEVKHQLTINNLLNTKSTLGDIEIINSKDNALVDRSFEILNN